MKPRLRFTLAKAGDFAYSSTSLFHHSGSRPHGTQSRRAHRANVTVHALDLFRLENAVALVKACGPLDILINNAGAIPQGTITGLDDATWRTAWGLKVFGFINVTREVYRDMCASKHGVIVNVVGTAGERPSANYLAIG